jgi:uncharacterized protein
MIRMKKLLYILTFLISIAASAQIDKVVPSKPNPPRLVNDFTKTLTAAQVEALEHKLVAYDDSTSNQIAVVIINSTDGNAVADVALEILRKWGVGNKDKNNGIVLLIAKQDRKMSIQSGYGLEGRITDLNSKSIIDNDLAPNFRQENYYRGIDQAIDQIMKAAAGAYKAPAGYGNKKKGIGIAGFLFLVIMLILIFAGSGGRRGGGGMMSGTGWLIGTLLSNATRGGGGWSGGGGGGGWSGGGGGGGFGGFGGGSGGGGGASGGW